MNFFYCFGYIMNSCHAKLNLFTPIWLHKIVGLFPHVICTDVHLCAIQKHRTLTVTLSTSKKSFIETNNVSIKSQRLTWIACPHCFSMMDNWDNVDYSLTKLIFLMIYIFVGTFVGNFSLSIYRFCPRDIAEPVE